MDRQAKQRKLNDFRRRMPHVSAVALAKILSTARSEGIPDGSLGRGELRAARDLENDANTQYGPIAQTMSLFGIDGTMRFVPVSHPFALLWTAVKYCAPFAAFFEERLRAVPSTFYKPWNLILYTDGVTPGNVIAPINKRKFETCYFSFLEFGANALSREDAWFTILTLFATEVQKISAGLSQIFAGIIKLFFEPNGFNMMTVGMLLPFASGSVRFFCRLRVVIQDGGAHKFVWHSRGDGATKLCLLCKKFIHCGI